MAKDMAISKRLKISKAQQEIFLAVGAASLIIGVAIVFAIYFIKYISFNTKIITEKDAAIAAYSSAISDAGICKKPSGKTYSISELEKCDPNNISAEEVTGSLRANILLDMAANEDLESVARDGLAVCYVGGTTDGEKYTQEKLLEKYQDAEDDDTRAYWLSMIKMCSALRVVPDALPAQQNEEALMSSLNQIFILSGWMPESLSPSGSTSTSEIAGVGAIPVSLSIEASSAVTHGVLSSIEKSIREFAIEAATIDWGGDDRLTLSAQATAYYAESKTAVEEEKIVYATDAAKKKGNKK